MKVIAQTATIENVCRIRNNILYFLIVTLNEVCSYKIYHVLSYASWDYRIYIRAVLKLDGQTSNSQHI